MIYYFIIVNIISFIIFGIDKKRSIKKKFRISENSLIFISLIGGWLGSLLAMFYFHHKNRKLKFLIAIPFIAIIWLIVLLNI